MHESPGTANVVYQNIPGEAPMELRCPRCLIGLTITNLLLATMILVLAIASVTFGTTVLQEQGILVGVEGSGLWGGAFLLVTSAIGLAGILKGNRCRIKAYYIMSAIAIMFVGVIVFTLAIIWAALSSAMAYYHHHKEHELEEKTSETVTAIQATIALLTLVYLGCAVAVFFMLCSNFCSCYGGIGRSRRPGGNQQPPTVVIQFADAEEGATGRPTGTHTTTSSTYGRSDGGSKQALHGAIQSNTTGPNAPLMEHPSSPSAPPPYSEKAGVPPV